MGNAAPHDESAWTLRDQNAVQHPGGGGGAQNAVVLSHGQGATVWDIEGRAYLDAQGGAWLNKVGYGRRELAEVAARQMEALGHFAFGFDYTNIPAIDFAEKLIARAPSNIGKVRYATGGGEADDHALQLARLYHFQKGAPRRRKILVHRDAYHGGTMGGVELTGGRPGLGGQTGDVIFLTPPRPAHPELNGNRDMTAFCVDELRAVIADHGADSIAAMFAELMIGPGGMIPLPDSYWPAMTAVLKEHGILFVADEVVTGFGRAGSWFVSNDCGLAPDMIVLAKGITSGYMPMAAVLLDEDVATTVHGLGPGNSYAGHATGCAVGAAHIDIIEREGLLENSRARGVQFLRELAPLAHHPLVGDIRGRGLMLGVELVVGKEDRRPLTGVAPQLNGTLPRYIRRKHGVLLGVRSSTIVLTPPLVLTSDEVSQICAALIDTFDQMNPNDFSFPDPAPA